MMGRQVYEKHLRNITNSYVRTGAVSGTVDVLSEYEIEVLGNIEVAARFMTPKGTVNSDIKGGFNASFMSWYADECFKEYLEYRKVHEEVSLSAWMGAATRQFAEHGYDLTNPGPKNEPVTAVMDESDVLDSGTSNIFARVVETSGDAVTEEVKELLTNPISVDSRGFDVWIEEDLFVFPDFNTQEYPVNIGEVVNLYTDPFGTDAYGFDVWAAAEVIEAERILYTSPIDIDSRGFDVWREPREWSQVIYTQPLGTDDRGFDQWVVPSKRLYSPVVGVVSRGFDIWKEASRLLSPWYGADNRGFDQWASGVSESGSDAGELGELLSECYGTDGKGFDVWKRPSVPASRDIFETSPSVQAPTVANNGNFPRVVPARPYSSVPARKSDDDLFADALLRNSARAKKASKKIISLLFR